MVCGSEEEGLIKANKSSAVSLGSNYTGGDRNSVGISKIIWLAKMT